MKLCIILLIEDRDDVLEVWKIILARRGNFKVFCAKTLKKAHELFPQQQWDAIVFDGCVGGDEYNSEPLIKDFKPKCKYGCVLVAASNSKDLVELMVAAGCTHLVTSKDQVPNLLYSIFRDQ